MAATVTSGRVLFAAMGRSYNSIGGRGRARIRRNGRDAWRVMSMPGIWQAPTHLWQERDVYGLIGQFMAASGKRDELIAILLDGSNEMPGCLSYVVARDPREPDAVWITEVWDNEASHKASLQSPTVQVAIAKAKPLIASFGSRQVVEPVGGHGLKG